MRVIIDRSLWARGHEGGQLFDGCRYCALGFVGKALGLSNTDMLDRQLIGQCMPHTSEVLDAYESLIAEVNDASHFDLDNSDEDVMSLDELREVRVIRAGLDAEIEFEFTGDYPK